MPPEITANQSFLYEIALPLLEQHYENGEAPEPEQYSEFMKLGSIQRRPTGVDGLVVAAAQIEACLSMGYTAQAIDIADKILGRMDSVDSDAVLARSSEMRFVAFAAGRAHFMGVQLGQALECFVRVFDAPDWISQESLGLQSFINWLAGSLQSAEDAVVRAERVHTAGGSNSLGSVAYCLARSGVAVARLDLPALATALSLIEPPASYPWRQSYEMFEAAFLGFSGEHAKSSVILHQVAHELVSHPEATVLSAERQYFAGVLLLLQGNAGATIRSCDQPETDPRHRRCFLALRAVAQLSLGLPKAALDSIEPCLAMGEAHDPHSASDLLTVLAAAHSELGRTESAKNYANAAQLLNKQSGGIVLALSPVPLPLEPGEGHEPSIVGLNANLRDVYAIMSTLSAREKLVLATMGDFDRIEDQAAHLFTSRNTLKAHHRSIYQKLGTTRRACAIDFAHRIGLSSLTLQA